MTTIANHSRRQLAVLMLAAGALALGFSAASIAQSARPAEIKLGIALSLTGNNAESGRDSKRGIELALEEMNRAGRFKTTKVNLVEADDASDSNRAVTAVQRLASEGVVGIVGGTVSNAVRAALPMAQRAKVPFVIVNAFTPGLTDVGDMVFQVSQPTGAFNKAAVALAAKKNKPTKAALLWAQDNPTTVGFRDDFIEALKANGIALVVDEPMKALDSDFTAQLRKAMNAGADLLLPNFNSAQNAAVIKQAHSLGYRPKTMGHVGDMSNSFTSAGGKEVIGHVANSAFFPGGSTAPLKTFLAAFQSKYNIPATGPAALGYQAMKLTGEAMGRMLDAGQAATADNLRLALGNLGPQPSVMGSSGTASFVNRILQYDGFTLILDENLRWQEWK